MKRNIILDVSNLFYGAFYAMSKEQDDILYAMANKSFMDTINKKFRDNECDEVILAFDGKKNWRKTYTASPHALTYKRYKGQRRQKMTDAEIAKLERFDAHVVEFREMLKEYTGLLVLHHDRLEADDLIAGYIQMHPNESHLVVSQDRDYLQLLQFPNVGILDPRTNKRLNLLEYDNDAKYFMFRKCLRGDTGDNVISAYPRIRETKIKEAYTDSYVRTNVMQNEFDVVIPEGDTSRTVRLKTSDIFEENEMLMDLTKQPDVIWEMMERSISNAKANRSEYNVIKFLRYCTRMDFQHLLQSASNYHKLLKGPKKEHLDH